MQNTRYSCRNLTKLEVPNSLKIPPVETELFHADRWTDRHNEANSRSSQFWDTA